MADVHATNARAAMVAYKKTHGLTLKAFAAQLGIKPPSLGDLLRGVNDPSLPTLQSFSRLSGQDVSAITGDQKGERSVALDPINNALDIVRQSRAYELAGPKAQREFERRAARLSLHAQSAPKTVHDFNKLLVEAIEDDHRNLLEDFESDSSRPATTEDEADPYPKKKRKIRRRPEQVPSSKKA